MLILKGNTGKSIVADALHRYNFAPIFVYDKETINTIDCDFIPSDEFSIIQFCEGLYDHIKEYNYELLPINMIVIYTNLPELDCGMIFDYAHKIEVENLVGNVIVTCKP